MGRRHEARRYLLEGMTPQEIAKCMGISDGSVHQYLCLCVGEGELYHSDIAFSIGERSLIESAIQTNNISVDKGAYRALGTASSLRSVLHNQGHNISQEIIRLYLITRDPRPDLYALICEIEIFLHGFVKDTLKFVHEDDWWHKGIPLQIRKECQIRREEDTPPLSEPYHYTTFIDLKATIDQRWSEFSKVLPKPLATNKQVTLQKLQRINEIRNRVMHPVKVMSEYESDYKFVRNTVEELKDLIPDER